MNSCSSLFFVGKAQGMGGLWEFRGLTPSVGATLVVALDGAGTRPAPTYSHTPQIPKEPLILLQTLRP